MRIRKGVYILLVCLCLFAAGYSLVQILTQMAQYREGEEAYASLADQVVQFSEPEELPQQQQEETEPVSADPWPEVDFDTLQSINPDVIGWLYGPDTGVNYPVVQGDDNAFYLTHLYDRSANSAGSLFLDYRAGALAGSRHWVIYGHYMNNGTMFADLLKYKEQSYYEEHPEFFLILPEGRYRVELFSGYVAEVKADAWRMSFSGEEDYQAWLAARKSASCFESSVQPGPEDQVLTLSTCSYEFSNARFVLHGILHKE